MSHQTTSTDPAYFLGCSFRHKQTGKKAIVTETHDTTVTVCGNVYSVSQFLDTYEPLNKGTANFLAYGVGSNSVGASAIPSFCTGSSLDPVKQAEKHQEVLNKNWRPEFPFNFESYEEFLEFFKFHFVDTGSQENTEFVVDFIDLQRRELRYRSVNLVGVEVFFELDTRQLWVIKGKIKGTEIFRNDIEVKGRVVDKITREELYTFSFRPLTKDVLESRYKYDLDQ